MARGAYSSCPAGAGKDGFSLRFRDGLAILDLGQSLIDCPKFVIAGLVRALLFRFDLKGKRRKLFLGRSGPGLSTLDQIFELLDHAGEYSSGGRHRKGSRTFGPR
jgi:hypothetical protein